jgi:trimeric autotransporter adhesin
MHAQTRHLLVSTAGATAPTSHRKHEHNRVSLRNFVSLTSNGAGRGGRSPIALAIRTVPVSLLLASVSYGGHADAQTIPFCPSQPTRTCGLDKFPGEGWLMKHGAKSAFMNDATSGGLPIYMNFRDELPLRTQTLTVSGTDMTGAYVNGSNGGTANINVLSGATVDLIEAGGAVRTDVNIIVDSSTLNGARTGSVYDPVNGGNKDFTLGSAIYLDLGDLGDHVITVRNGSELNGSIVTGGLGGAQTVNVSGARLTPAAFMWLALAPIRFR